MTPLFLALGDLAKSQTTLDLTELDVASADTFCEDAHDELLSSLSLCNAPKLTDLSVQSLCTNKTLEELVSPFIFVKRLSISHAQDDFHLSDDGHAVYGESIPTLTEISTFLHDHPTITTFRYDEKDYYPYYPYPDNYAGLTDDQLRENHPGVVKS